ncbi:hypothetical protein L3X38_010657 [Prunus dulcis]|uniref:Uncharacterized protein n=1 Tax=Prunus dulcis TaxID=3755 RepID=A0AAD4WIE7_PRUDU|nr:hypothetical protein L3X38_010657 [Prunus dulcis]
MLCTSCDSIIGTLLEILGKNKDDIATRLDLLNTGVKTDLQPEYGERHTLLPPGPWNLSRAEKRAVCNSFYGMTVPEDKHNTTFIQWLCFKVQSQLNEEDNNGVSENLRWLAAGPSKAAPSYRSYLIKSIKFNTKAQDDVRAVQKAVIAELDLIVLEKKKERKKGKDRFLPRGEI